MSVLHCCDTVSTGRDGMPPSRRFLEAAGGVLPGVLLALLPKCPACLAAWLAIATGVGISAAAASRLRTTLVILCIAPLVYLAIRETRRRLRTPLRYGAATRGSGIGITDTAH